MRITADNLTLRYGDTVALDALTVDLPAGSIYGLLGRNGSGKTSLLSLIAGHRRPTSGTLTVGGADPFENAAVMGGTAFVRDVVDATDAEPARAALRFAADLRPTFDLDYAHDLAGQFGLPLGKGVGGLSRGQKSALGVVLGLAARTPLTIFDEAYLGMDAPSRYLFYRLLLDDYVADPRTVILSTHLIEEVANLFEKVLVIDRGRLVAYDETDELRGRGVTVTGPAAAVDAFVAGRTVLGEQRLGGTRAATVYGRLDAADRARAADAGLDLGPVGLQDLFVHLTGSAAEPRAQEAHR
ncbi:ATP-binding cassette domain-containing protein [Spirilliplanes yamanashiensis]|uniref:ABC transporter n=1 Tax=Spirilliplanes yamanashiensis TaxID=42233 RepID=A0A8J4DGW3_9ACTN|nr:ABC transporter ATP-binding protein [Spirilliplanes yamanashiensis]MDP9819759.1 ABC-2 type transport system ATP-binding protein [Spirilliplanes yamanashiensis]GIJ01421.1 ABC transporter [Spirilliplanes yamanashiensis]